MLAATTVVILALARLNVKTKCHITALEAKITKLESEAVTESDDTDEAPLEKKSAYSAGQSCPSMFTQMYQQPMWDTKWQVILRLEFIS